MISRVAMARHGRSKPVGRAPASGEAVSVLLTLIVPGVAYAGPSVSRDGDPERPISDDL
jgi:hypothetical protein